jgi:hypothetical protein
MGNGKNQFIKIWDNRFNKLEAIMKSYTPKKDSRKRKLNRGRKNL